jgi:hypothetical protein
MALDGSIDLPLAGPVKKRHLAIGGAVVAGVVGYAWWKHFRSSDMPAEIDPGFADFSGGLQTGTGGTTQPGIPWEPADGADPDGLPPTTNAQWTQRGVDWMQNLGFDPQLVATTLGKYLARVPVTQVEADIIRTVEGAIGKPPVGEYRIIMVGNPPPAAPAPPAPIVGRPVYRIVNGGGGGYHTD